MAVKFVRPNNPKLAKDPWQIQLDQQGKLRHLLSIQGLKPHHLTDILDRAESFLDPDGNLIKQPLLQNTVIFNIFFEPSTRTLKTFEVAQKQLSADIHNLNVSTSSTSKGETLLDTLSNLKAMYADMLVVRHSESGAPLFFAEHVGEGLSIVNAGDGRHEHPTQALLDMFTIRKHKGDFTKLKVAIVGDVLHSRVARSQIHALNLLSVDELRVVAPSTLMPLEAEKMGVQVYHDIEAGIKNCDVVIMVRLQKERMDRGLLPSESEYYKRYGLSPERLSLPKPDAIIMHPGPANRGVEIASEVMDGKQSVILDQVSNGIAVRMAVLSILKENQAATIQAKTSVGDNA